MKAFLKTIIVLAVSLLFSRSAFAQSYDVSGVQILMTSDQAETVLRANGYLPDARFQFVDLEAIRAAVKTEMATGVTLTSTAGLATNTHKKTQPNFNQRVTDKLADPTKLTTEDLRFLSLAGGKFPLGPTRVLKSMAFQKDGGRESILVEFTAYPSGARVNKVAYILEAENISNPDFRAQVTEKYGKPNAGRAYLAAELLSQDNIEGKEVLQALSIRDNHRITLNHRNQTSYNRAIKAAAQNAKISSNPIKGKKSTSF